MNPVVFCHDENSPFAQPEDCLSVANSTVGGKWKTIAAPALKIDARSAQKNFAPTQLSSTQIQQPELQPITRKRGKLHLFRTIQQRAAEWRTALLTAGEENLVKHVIPSSTPFPFEITA
jgi:hypothetical protein